VRDLPWSEHRTPDAVSGAKKPAAENGERGTGNGVQVGSRRAGISAELALGRGPGGGRREAQSEFRIQGLQLNLRI
jgi:hypothetical protein